MRIATAPSPLTFDSVDQTELVNIHRNLRVEEGAQRLDDFSFDNRLIDAFHLITSLFNTELMFGLRPTCGSDSTVAPRPVRLPPRAHRSLRATSA